MVQRGGAEMDGLRGNTDVRDLLDQARRWREKADELRAAADSLTNAVARDSLLDMADGYEGLAGQMVKFAATLQRDGASPGSA